jgi:hypothetical protein
MDLGAFLMDNAETWGVIVLIIQGVVAWVLLSQRARLKNAEASADKAKSDSERVKREADTKLEQVRGENAETMALFKLLEQQLTNTANLADSIREQNKILQLQGKQHADALQLVVDSNQLSAQTSREIAQLVTNFQQFSQGQHTETRRTIQEAHKNSLQEVTERLQQVKDEMEMIRVGLNGHFKELEPLFQRRFDAMEKRLLDAITALKTTPPPDVPDISPAPPVVNTDIGEDEDGKPDTSLLDLAS